MIWKTVRKSLKGKQQQQPLHKYNDIFFNYLSVSKDNLPEFLAKTHNSYSDNNN